MLSKVLYRLPIAPHHAILLVILLIGAILRFWNLDGKPLWLDEVLTGLFTMGRTATDVPLDQFFSLTALDRVFTVQPGLSCAQIAQTLTIESVHPPLFFCLMYRWMGWLRPDAEHWVWVMRSLPALLGVGAIGAMYWLNRLAFSPAAGLISAALMAVSPFAVYLSQEARHYTLPMLLITLALAGLGQIQQDISRRRSRPWVWIGWMVLNSIGLYVHYFFLLAIVAQVAALGSWLLLERLGQRRQILSRHWMAVGVAIGGILLSYVPWLPTMINHMQRPETDWLIPYEPDWLDRLAPLYQTIAGWVLMVIALPVENLPEWGVVLSVLGMLVFAVWMAVVLVRGWRRAWQDVEYRSPLFLIAGFTLIVVLQFLAIAYVLGKDITAIPRYNFVYYPSVCALLGIGFSQVINVRSQDRSTAVNEKIRRLILPIVLLMGLISSSLVVNNLVFLKSFEPDRVAQHMSFDPSQPVAVVVSYHSPQEVALGLSFALELRKRYAPETIDAQVKFAFLDRSAGYTALWRNLRQLPQPLPLPLNLWIVASPGMRSTDYPETVRIRMPNSDRRVTCAIDRQYFERVGFPYQLFRCSR